MFYLKKSYLDCFNEHKTKYKRLDVAQPRIRINICLYMDEIQFVWNENFSFFGLYQMCIKMFDLM